MVCEEQVIFPSEEEGGSRCEGSEGGRKGSEAEGDREGEDGQTRRKGVQAKGKGGEGISEANGKTLYKGREVRSLELILFPIVEEKIIVLQSELLLLADFMGCSSGSRKDSRDTDSSINL